MAPTLALFPLHAVNADGSCGCGSAKCEDAGKHPMVLWSQIKPGEVIGGPEDCGYGVATGSRSGVWVLDVDRKDGKDGVIALDALGELPDTLTVSTPTGGFHLYFLMPSFPIKNSKGKLGEGLDVRGDGGYVVAPDSQHKNGGFYRVIDERDPVEAPQWLLDLVKSDAKKPVIPFSVQGVDVTSEHGQKRLAKAREFVTNAPPAVQGKGGSEALWRVALFLVRSCELPIDVAKGLVLELYNPRCDPQWTEAEVFHKLLDARDKSDLPTGIPINDDWLRVPEEKAKLRKTPQKGHEYTHVPGFNAPTSERVKVPFSELVQRLTLHEEWAGVWQYDELKKRLYAVDPPMRLDAETIGLSDRDISSVRTWFECNGITCGKNDVFDAIETAGREGGFHPVREYLDGLKWDGQARIDFMAGRLFGADDVLSAAFVRKTMIAAVRRVLNPGVQVDTVLVLYEPKGAQKKSTFVRELFGQDWSRSQMPDITTKDASAAVQGFWGIELSEMDGILRKDPSEVREFITRTYDDYRPAYGRKELRQPRSCVFIGTTNEQEFLTDSTSNRRYWPIAITKKIDIETVKSERDQWWAEAYVLAKTGEEHWFENEEETEAAREMYKTRDVWEGELRTFLTAKEWTTSGLVWMKCLQQDVSDLDMKAQKRIANVLRSLGCESSTRREEGFVVRGWKVPAELASAKKPPGKLINLVKPETPQ